MRKSSNGGGDSHRVLADRDRPAPRAVIVSDREARLSGGAAVLPQIPCGLVYVIDIERLDRVGGERPRVHLPLYKVPLGVQADQSSAWLLLGRGGVALILERART